MTELETLKEYLKVAIETLGWTDVKVFDYSSEEDEMFDITDPVYHGLRISESSNVGNDYEIIILPRKDMIEQESILGKHKHVVTFFDIHMPVYDDGDWSVGIQGGWITDPEDEPAFTFRYAGDVAKQVVLSMLEEQLDTRLQNLGEYLYFKEQEEISEKYLGD